MWKAIKKLMNRDEISIKVKDYKGREILWFTESYLYHMNKHPEVKRHFDKIKTMLKKPQLIDKNKKRKSTDYYYECGKDKLGKMKYLKLIIDYNEEPFFIRSAHMTTDCAGATVYLGA